MQLTIAIAHMLIMRLLAKDPDEYVFYGGKISDLKIYTPDEFCKKHGKKIINNKIM